MLENKFITVAIKGGLGSGRHPDEGKVERAKVSYIPMSKEKEKIATESEQVMVDGNGKFLLDVCTISGLQEIPDHDWLMGEINDLKKIKTLVEEKGLDADVLVDAKLPFILTDGVCEDKPKSGKSFITAEVK